MLRARRGDVETAVQAHLDRVLAPYADLPVGRAMGYAAQGGKRLRALLVMESAALHGVEEGAIWPACAIEAMHAYSLVHDDLPSMDDDAERRGRPTVHIAFDEATAVLAGDALQSLAFELLAAPSYASADVRADLVLTLARAAGVAGMVRGQALDIAAETGDFSLDQMADMQAGKTGALFVWSAQAGARMAQADPGPLTAYATAFGAAFQIADDVLDVTGDAARMGKAVGKDAAAGKATYVGHLGLDGAKRRAEDLVQTACDALECYGDRARTLRALARFITQRQN